ncbi:shematrin-like protein 2 [Paramacrobiotus metropolitanus]|uniref:shematrin-like protein 2 n=1 Tax=Paramacrobiotus metropolitanus TaxID=2943436 RepID=UPI00244565B7|nr:shematrin-like protein 2 [Paramacrobiotus metropolitanus]
MIVAYISLACLVAVKGQVPLAFGQDQTPDVLQLYQLLDDRSDQIMMAAQELGAAIDALKNGHARDFLKNAFGSGMVPVSGSSDASAPMPLPQSGLETVSSVVPTAETPSIAKPAELTVSRPKRSYGRYGGYGRSYGGYGGRRYGGYSSGYGGYGGYNRGYYGGYGGYGYGGNRGYGYGGYGRYYG